MDKGMELGQIDLNSFIPTLIAKNEAVLEAASFFAFISSEFKEGKVCLCLAKKRKKKSRD